jgi:hypothetical protein
MNTEPLKKYIQSLETFKEGHSDEAGILLSQSIGIEKPTLYMKENLSNLLDSKEPNDAVLTLVINETKRDI